MPSSFLNTYNCDQSSQFFQRNNIKSNGTHGGRFSPVLPSRADVRTPPSPRRIIVPGHLRQVETTTSDKARHRSHLKPAPDDTPPTPPKRKWFHSSSNNIINDVPQHALPPQIRRDGRMSPVPLFKRSSISSSSLGSIPLEESCESNRLYIAPGRLSPLPPLDAKRERSKKTQIKNPRSHSPTPPKKVPAAPPNAALQFHSPQPPRKRAMMKKTAMTPPIPRRENIPAPLVLTPSGTSFSDSVNDSTTLQSPGPPRRPAPLPPFEKSPSSNRHLSPMPPVSGQDSSSPRLPPKPPHLKSSPVSSPRGKSPVPPQFSYSPPSSPTALSLSSANESPPIVPVRIQETRLCRAPLPPPPVTSQPRSSRPPLPLPKPEALQRPSLIVTTDCDNNLPNPPSVRDVKEKETRKNHANRKHSPRRSPQASQVSRKETENSRKESEEEEESCCTGCLKDCFADLPEYILDFFC